MTKIICLGNAGDQTDTSETVSFLIDGSSKILLETGPGIIRQLTRAGYSASEIDIVIVTHCHGDHTLGYPYFLFRNFTDRIIGKKGPDTIHVIALDEVLKGLREMTSFCYPPGKFPSFEVKEHKAVEFEPIFINNIKIIPASVIHSVPNIGIRIEINNISIAYSSDTIYNKNIIKLAENCDLLIHEAFGTEEIKDMAMHIKHGIASNAGKVANEANVKKLALVHMMDTYFDKYENLIKEANKYFNGKVIVPNELEEIKL